MRDDPVEVMDLLELVARAAGIDDDAGRSEPAR
jgi:hypothetical protein